MAPPIDPADNIIININIGKARAKPAKGIVPNCPINHASSTKVTRSTNIDKIFGAAKRISVGPIGETSIVSF